MRALWLCLLVTTAVLAVPSSGDERRDPMEGWHFRFKQFPIGAWWGPGATEPEMRLYSDAGFNLVMMGRYMEGERYGDADALRHELDLAGQFGLGAMVDTYTKNDRPWGGTAGPYEPHPIHHAASLLEFQWLEEHYGSHPALVGYMIGDDQGQVSERTRACTDYLREHSPDLFPWLCGWISPEDLAANGNPISDPQIYPTLYNWDQPAEAQAQSYATAYAGYMRECQEHGVLFWPMFNTSCGEPNPDPARDLGWCPSDSLVRFPTYLALAYGAQGIWYFTYGGGAISRTGEWDTPEKARSALTPLYPVVKEANLRIAAWGPKLLGTEPAGLFGTAFGAKGSGWPFPVEDEAGAPGAAEALAQPAVGKLVEEMSPDLVVGILTKDGHSPLAMVVDCRTSKGFGDVPARQVTVRFAPPVAGTLVLEGGQAKPVAGPEVGLRLKPGEGQLLELRGARRLDDLCEAGAIYAPETPAAAVAPVRASAADLASVRAAKLRIDVYGSDGGEFAAKYIELNGERIAQVPANTGDRWRLCVIDLTPEQIHLLRPVNRVVIRTESGDAWKFRNLCLAVRLPTGAWGVTNAEATVHSVANWAYSEGETWGADGVAGPMELGF